MNAEAAYADSVERLFTWQRQGRLTDKELARLAGLSPNTVKSCRQRRRLFGLEAMYRLRAELGERWWSFITAEDRGQDATLEARAVAVEANLHMLRAEIRSAKETV